ncbi:AAA family ATPase [Mesorhizobium sp. M1428]|uniref:ATP-binding protein n=1 Tax=unclassified Mesorhizobium TaxID=325217 RepID=UPI003339620E
MDVGSWLRSLGLGQYAAAFEDNAVDAETLRELTAEDLKELGVTLVGHRRKLLAAMATLADRPVSSGNYTQSENPDRGNGTDGDVAERRQLTVMFCDLVGSTTLSAELDPEDLREVIGDYQAAVTEEVTKLGGFVAKYMGDGVLVYFGYPHAHEEDAERALRAGLALVERIGRLEWRETRLSARVGIATGIVVVGDLIGHGSAQERGVVGETPNLSARLQAMARPGNVLSDDTTRRLVGELFECRDLGAVEVKGLPTPVRAWEVAGLSMIDSRFEALHATRLTPMIGRDEELGLLRRRWERAKTGEGQVVLVSGEAGIGKSRLIAAIQDNVGDDPLTTLRYFCSPHHRDSMLYPFIAQLERWSDFARDDRPAARLDKLKNSVGALPAAPPDTLSLLADLLGIADESIAPVTADPPRKREMMLSLWPRLFEALTRDRPLLVLFEDAHWTDATSLEVLDRAVSQIARLPALLVVTFRPDFQPSWIGQPAVSALSLSRLLPHHTSALIAGVTRGKPLPPEILGHIVHRTDGVPLFAEELTSMLVESGMLREEEEQFVLDQPLPALAIPASLQASLMARLDRLAPVKEIAQIGAAIGREFSYELLAAVARRTDAQLTGALDQLTEAGLVFRRGTPPNASYIFKHALVQDAAYNTLLRARRRDLHARIGHVLEAGFPEIVTSQPELLAHHFAEAGLDDAAIDYWRKGGERALERSANAEAAAHLERAIRQLVTLPESKERNRRELPLQMALGSTTRALKGHAADETLKVYNRARALLDETVPVKQQMAVLYGAWTVPAVRGDWVSALEIARQSFALAQSDDDPEAAAFASRMNGIALWLTGSLEEAVPHLERAVRLYAPGSGNVTDLRYSQDHAVWALSVLALVLWSLGHPDRATEAAVRSLEWARAINHGMTTGFSLSFGSVLWGFFQEGPRSGGADADEALEFCMEHDLRSYISWGQFYCGLAQVRHGEHHNGLELMSAGMAGMDKINFRILWTAHLGHLAWALASAGKVGEAMDVLSKALRAVDQYGERAYEVELHRLRGDLLWQRGAVKEAEIEFCRAVEIARAQKAKSWELRAATSLARLHAERGHSAQALEVLSLVQSWFAEDFDTADLRAARTLLHTLELDAGVG